VTIDECLEELKGHAGEFGFDKENQVRHLTLQVNGTGSNPNFCCPLNVLCQYRKFTFLHNSQIGRMSDILEMQYDPAQKIAAAADGLKGVLRKKLLEALGLEEPKKPRTKKADSYDIPG